MHERPLTPDQSKLASPTTIRRELTVLAMATGVGIVVALSFLVPILLFPSLLAPIVLAEVVLYGLSVPLLFDFMDKLELRYLARAEAKAPRSRTRM